ncbi:MAG: SpoIIE family protein phosphatase [Flavobacteriales bacterium]
MYEKLFDKGSFNDEAHVASFLDLHNSSTIMHSGEDFWINRFGSNNKSSRVKSNNRIKLSESAQYLIQDAETYTVGWVMFQKPVDKVENDSLDSRFRLKLIQEELIPGIKKELIEVVGSDFTDYQSIFLEIDTLVQHQKTLMGRLDSFEDYENPINVFLSYKDISEGGTIEIWTRKVKEHLRSIRDQKLVQRQLELQGEQEEKEFLRNTVRNAVIILVAILIVLLVLFISNRKTRKLNRVISQKSEEVLKAHEQLSEKNQEILDSIEYAKRIQNAILPPHRIVKESLQQSFILYKPKDVVAGDFYWMESCAEASDSEGEHSLVYYAAADCTGHGVPGAMVSVICVNGLNRAVREFGLREPGEILDKTRELVIKEFEKSEEDVKDGMDISLCALNTKTKELKWAGANNPLWIVRKGAEDVEEIKADKQPIGKFELAKPFTTHTIALNEGDTIYTFSDGFPDQFGGENGKKYKSGKFKRTLLDLSHQDITAQADLLDEEFESWRGSIEQIDDVCVIGVRI